MSVHTPTSAAQIESPYAWTRLGAALALMTIASVGMYSMSVALTAVQAEFGVTRAEASLPYTFAMLGFGVGGILMGRFADRYGVMRPLLVGALALALGLVAAGSATTLWQFSLAQGLLIGMLGTSASFAPLIADISHWFSRRRGLAVGICASGNYLGGAIWPPVLQYFFDTAGWRATFVGAGVFCGLAMLPLALLLRRPAPVGAPGTGGAPAAGYAGARLGVSPNTLLALLCIAGVSCCVAMAMPQVHIVAYCGDLGYAAARGAEMLALMLAFGVVSRLASGWISDRIGGVRTLLLGAGLQVLALALFVPAEGLITLYVVSALFGLFQGGIVPSYAIIVREYFDPREAGARLGWVILATLIGMALGGWMSGAIFDLAGSYRAAFVNGMLWGLVTVSVAAWLLLRTRLASPRRAAATRGG